ncbi:MAG: hypothetical protein EP330_31040 [Deltaproteobacteria bacterium]|nr:MAG: hypothetical protein EP330_31040 [Deltaproteobacteria bacterium]
MLIALASGAERPCGEAELTAADFSAWVEAADSALNHDDVLAHGQVWRQIQDGVPCMVVPVPREEWASFLQGLAVVDHAAGDDWQPALTTALLIDGELDRSWLQPELQAFAPLLPSTPEEALPTDAVYYVDGKRVKTLPALPGIHIVQREYVGVWEGMVIDDGVFPTAWRADVPLAPEPVTTKRKPRLGLALAGAGGAVAFGAASLATGFAGVKAQRDLDREGYATMRGLNNTAVVLTGLSGGVAVLGFVLPTKK